MTAPITTVSLVTIRHVHLKLDQETYDLARQAAAADRRSLANWLTVIVDRAIQQERSRTAVDQSASDSTGRAR